MELLRAHKFDKAAKLLAQEDREDVRSTTALATYARQTLIANPSFGIQDVELGPVMAEIVRGGYGLVVIRKTYRLSSDRAQELSTMFERGVEKYFPDEQVASARDYIRAEGDRFHDFVVVLAALM